MLATLELFLYSQDLSNRKTDRWTVKKVLVFLYSQDLSNRKTTVIMIELVVAFLYSQDLSNRKTHIKDFCESVGFCTLKI